MTTAAASSTAADTDRARRATEEIARADRAREAQQAAQQAALQTQQPQTAAQGAAETAKAEPALPTTEQARTAAVERGVGANETRGREAAALVGSGSTTMGQRPAAPPMPPASTDPTRLYRENAPGQQAQPESAPPRDPSKPEDTRGQAREALGEVNGPGKKTAYGRHLAAVREGLAREGLPTEAGNVRVVANDQDRNHGGAVLRSATGEAGLGRNAESHLQVAIGDPQHTAERLGLSGDDVTRISDHGDRADKIERGDASLADLAKLGVDRLEGTVHEQRSELSRIRDLARADPSKPTVGNMSWGSTIQQEAFDAAATAVRAPAGSPLHAELKRELGRAPREQDMPRVARLIAQRMDRSINDPEQGKHLREAKAAFGRELKDASEKDRVTIVHAAANQFEESKYALRNERWSANITSDVPGQITVGATDLGKDPRVVGDERMARFSSSGEVEVAAPGVQLPVGQREARPDGSRSRTPEAIDGTSFASPYVAGTVALMLQANPQLRTADIQHLLQSTAKNIRGERDGAGVVDPVAAVRAARDFRVR